MTTIDKSNWYQPSGAARFTQAGWQATVTHTSRPVSTTTAGGWLMILFVLAVGVLLVVAGAWLVSI
jgi:hypothetical protein